MYIYSYKHAYTIMDTNYITMRNPCIVKRTLNDSMVTLYVHTLKLKGYMMYVCIYHIVVITDECVCVVLSSVHE